MEQSANPDFWLSSGGLFFFGGGFGHTIEGDLPPDDKWRRAYRQSNPRDTDGGLHPQNVFRLVTRRTFQNFAQEVVFSIRAVNRSASPNRDGSNGVFLFAHYLDDDNLYVAGLRTDGAAVAKKKVGGRYFTMASQPVFAGRYDRNARPNLIPEGQSIGLATDTHTDPDGSVTIGVLVNGSPVLQATDDGRRFAGRAISEPGLAGIRTDFLDVDFSGYRTSEE